MNAMKPVRLKIWDWLAGAIPTGRAVRRASLLLGLAAGLRVAAQPATPPGPPDDAVPPEALGQMVQAADSGQIEEMAPADEAAATNGMGITPGPGGATNRFLISHAQGTNRFLNSVSSASDDRRSRGRRFRSRSDRSGGSSAGGYGSGSDTSGPGAGAATNNPTASLDYAAFKLIVDRNIFDPNRMPHRPGVASIRRPNRVDWLRLVGTMSYEKGTIAFFEGSSSDYTKALKVTDTNTIAGYKLTGIEPNGVKLAFGTNVLDLTVGGAQLRREEDGPWMLAGSTGSYSETPASSSATNSSTTTAASEPAPSGPDSDVLKKLMERRAKE